MSHSQPILATVLTAVMLVHAAPAVAAPGAKRVPGERRAAITDFWKRETPAKVKKRQRRFTRALGLVRGGVTSGLLRLRVINKPSVRVGHALLGLLALRNPNQVKYWYWYGYTSLLLGRHSLTIRAWKRVWKLEPNHWDTSSMAFELGILYAKLGRFAESVAVYAKGMPASFHLTTRGIMASNCAESYMALAKLKKAVTMYRLSIRLRPQNNNAAYWGLMLAYDRLALTAAADRARQQALTLDPNLRGLVGAGVFFVPAGDVHYYLALAYEGQGQIRRALDQWRRYLRARPQTRWKKRVHLHQARLKRVMASWKPRVYLMATRPVNQHRQVAALAGPITTCYQRRAKQLKVTPRGQLPLYLTLKKQRITAIRIGWSPRPVSDPALRRCILRSLRNRLVTQVKHARIVAVFQLERGP